MQVRVLCARLSMGLVVVGATLPCNKRVILGGLEPWFGSVELLAEILSWTLFLCKEYSCTAAIDDVRRAG